MKILVTGGAGYIGSHTCVELIAQGHDVFIIDNWSNSHPKVIDRITEITGRSPTIIEGDVRNQKLLEQILTRHECQAVIHFAGLKSVSESAETPVAYYDNNINGTISLLLAMQNCGLNTLVFSSSATVYGEPSKLPLTETHPLSATNPYGRSKLFCEELLRDLHKASPDWRIAILRYFNPVGAHESGLIGEDPLGIPNNLMPFVAQTAAGQRNHLNIWGNDYPTPDGTGIRDYIHVMDLAEGHIRTLNLLHEAPQCTAINLGTGIGYSVLEVLAAFEKASEKHIPIRFANRRPGDVASCYADPSLSQRLLGWKSERNLLAMCTDHWRWQKNNPNGYR